MKSIIKTSILFVFIICFASVESYGSGTITAFADKITDDATAGAHSIDINHNRGLAVVVGKAGVVSVIDISDPENMNQTDSVEAGLTDTQDVKWLSDRYCWIGSSSRWLVLDIDDPDNIAINQNVSTDFTGPLNQSALYYDSVSEKTYLYSANKGVSNANGSVEIFNVTDPSAVVYIGAYANPDNDDCHGLDVDQASGVLVYVSKQGAKQITTLDVATDPESPAFLDSIAHANGTANNQVAISNDGNYAFACGSPTDFDDGKLNSYNISDPENITAGTSYSTGKEGHGVWLTYDDFLYVGTGDFPVTTADVVVFDASTSTSLSNLQVYAGSTNFNDVHQMQPYNGYLILTCGGPGTAYTKNVSSVKLSHIPAQVSDGIKFSESVEYNTYLKTVTDSFKLSESITRNIYSKTVSDGMKFSESVDPIKIKSATVTDGIVFNDHAFIRRSNIIRTNVIMRGNITTQ